MKTRTQILATLAAAATLMAVGLDHTGAMWAMTIEVPAARVISNLNKRIAKSPNDAMSHYNLGRVHSYLVSRGGDQVPGYGGVDEPTSLPSTLQPEHELKAGFADAAQHAQAAIKALNTAIKLQPDRGSFRYALANVAEASIPLVDSIRTAPMLDVNVVAADDAAAAQVTIKNLLQPGAKVDELLANATTIHARFGDDPSMASLRALQWALIRERSKAPAAQLPVLNKAIAAVWRAEAIEQYFETFTLSLASESRHTEQSLRGLTDFIAYQAAKDYCRLVPESQQPKVRRDIIAAAIKSFESLPPCSAITPILVPMTSPGSAGIDALLAPDARVKFDLDATSRGLTWSWVKPTTGILVWDPRRVGKITSGMQLFGNATWWMMFENGYRAMDALDDNANGQLDGPELSGLALWFDGNSNGVCDSGEVVGLARMGITALSTTITGTTADGSLESQRGVRFRDGRVLPTFDWITHSIDSTSTPAALPERTAMR